MGETLAEKRSFKGDMSDGFVFWAVELAGLRSRKKVNLFFLKFTF
jgi:hypothetical protein